jgi:hypothetical protein
MINRTIMFKLRLPWESRQPGIAKQNNPDQPNDSGSLRMTLGVLGANAALRV